MGCQSGHPTQAYAKYDDVDDYERSSVPCIMIYDGAAPIMLNLLGNYIATPIYEKHRD